MANKNLTLTQVSDVLGTLGYMISLEGENLSSEDLYTMTGDLEQSSLHFLLLQSRRKVKVRKGENITVRSEGGRGVNCPLVDIDYRENKIWVRFPTNQVLEMDWNPKRNLYVGRMAKMEFTVNPEES